MIQQTQQQKQLLKFTPQQIQMLNLLLLNTQELEQKIKDEIEENPALEIGDENDDDNNSDNDSDQEDMDLDDSEKRDDLNEDFMGEYDDDLPNYKEKLKLTTMRRNSMKAL